MKTLHLPTETLDITQLTCRNVTLSFSHVKCFAICVITITCVLFHWRERIITVERILKALLTHMIHALTLLFISFAVDEKHIKREKE